MKKNIYQQALEKTVRIDYGFKHNGTTNLISVSIKAWLAFLYLLAVGFLLWLVF